jgi:hypothetical protein
MARPRKPSNILELNGAFKRNPSRGKARENEPKPEGEIGDPPDHLPADVAGCWREIVGISHPGVLCKADRLIVEHAARILALQRERNWTDRALLTRFEAVLGKLGMSPADRSKVAVIKPGGENPYAEFG